MDGSLQWLHEGRVLAGQLAAAKPDDTAWVGIYPLAMNRPGTAEILRRERIAVLPGVSPRVYRVRVFEIADRLREASLGERDLTNVRDLVVMGDDALFARLAEIGIPLDVLDAPRRVGYPL